METDLELQTAKLETKRILPNIAKVVNDGLCTGCGTCAGICPVDAISMRISKGLFLPQIDATKCTDCSLCIRSCAGCSVDFRELNSRIFGRQPEDDLLGNYLECYVGHSNDESVRFDSSSGGLVTQLLIFALRKGLVDGVIVAKMRKDRPLEPEAFIARSEEELVTASRSKYCPVTLSEALRQVLREKGKFAVVGLPCHIHGIRKAEAALGQLGDKIVFHFGLMCSHTVSFDGTSFLLSRVRVDSKQVKSIAYRGMGWPGYMRIELVNRSVKIPYVGSWKAYWPSFACFFFTPVRCAMCPDETNELADVSFGDAWLPEFKCDKSGQSIVVARTENGKRILELAHSEGCIWLKSISPEQVKRSQAHPLKFKKCDFETRLAILESRWIRAPIFEIQRRDHSSSISCYARSLFVLSSIELSKSRFFRHTLSHVPFPLFRLYYAVYRVLMMF